MSFYHEIQKYNWEQITESIYNKTENDVKQALGKDILTLSDFQALISPAAKPFIEQMAKKSMQITQKRFGKTIQMYVPLYLSNYCTNGCVYCGFNHSNQVERKKLNQEEVLNESLAIKKLGFEHILLVTGEDNRQCNTDYIAETINTLKPHFALISVEVQPMDEPDYQKLISKGLNSVYIYQETYHEHHYRKYHPKGRKANYQYRLETPDRLGKAGVHKIGLGCLLGLEEWRTDSFFTAAHLQYLERNYWQSKYSISFPRLRPHTGGYEPDYTTNHADLLQLICAYRLFNEHVELSLSTRESPYFRNHMLKLGVTAYSAGSKTNPGGYAKSNSALEQFAVNDDRSPQEVMQMIKDNGYEVVWKDWDVCMQIN